MGALTYLPTYLPTYLLTYLRSHGREYPWGLAQSEAAGAGVGCSASPTLALPIASHRLSVDNLSITSR